MADLFDPDKDYTKHYTHYPNARKVAIGLYIVLSILLVLATIRAIKLIFF